MSEIRTFSHAANVKGYVSTVSPQKARAIVNHFFGPDQCLPRPGRYLLVEHEYVGTFRITHVGRRYEISSGDRATLVTALG